MKAKWLLILILSISISPIELLAKTEKHRLSWRSSPSTSMVIGWNQLSGDNGTVFYGPKDCGTNFKQYPLRQKVDRVQKYGHLNSHFVRLKNLQPNTAYYFIIKDSDSTSRRFWFKTAPSSPQKVSFIAGGDSRSQPKYRKIGNRLVAKLRPLFILFGGDYTYTGKPEEWDEWLNDWELIISKDGRMYPIIAAHGNHENRDMQQVHKLFDTPNPDMYFAFNIGGNMLRIWVLNSELLRFNKEKTTEQQKWLKKDLKQHARINWKIMCYHKPMRPHTKRKSEGTYVYDAWAELFYKHQVDLAIESDTHMVKRTYPIRPSLAEGNDEGFVRDPKGTVYIGEGSWAAPKRAVNDNKSWTLASDSFYQFKLIHADEKKLESLVVKFENEENVEALTENNILEIPKGLKIWQPKSGAVLTLPFVDHKK